MGGGTLGGSGGIAASGGMEGVGGDIPSAGGSGSGGDTGAEALCDPAVSEATRKTVADAIDALFIDKNVDAIDTYWGEPYLQHNPIGMSGVAAFRSLMSGFVTQPSFNYTRIRTLAECDLGIVQGQYSQTGIIFDMFRVKDGKLIEHWDSDTNQASPTAGPTEIEDRELNDENRERVEGFIESVLIAGEGSVDDFLSAEFKTRRAEGVTGGSAWLAQLDQSNLSYSQIHHVIADGNFVFVMSEGELNGAGYAFYDLFRVEAGAIIEHWDSRRSIPGSTASGLPIF